MRQTLRALLLEAVRYFSETGYRDETDVEVWLIRLHAAIERELPTDSDLRRNLVVSLQSIYKRDVERLGIESLVPGVTKYTVDRIAPHLRAELDRRIFAGIDLIKLNRKAAIDKTLQRFSGWITSVPKGGAAKGDRRETVAHILKPTKQVKFEARRVAIDQGHKLVASIAAVVAIQEGAIAAIWHDRGEHDHGYDARPVHLARSGKMFLVRDSWAIEEGLIAKGSLQYTDEIEMVAELPYCSCFYEYVPSPGRLPDAILTAKGRAWVNGTR